MTSKIIFILLCAVQCVTTGLYVNSYRKPGTKKLGKKMLCSTVFVACGVCAAVGTGGLRAFSAFILLGLALSWLGDLFLAKGLQGSMFVLGLGSFFLGHVAYICAFFSTGIEELNPGVFLSLGEIITLALLLALVFAVKFACKIHFDGMGVPVFLYAVAICLMLTKAAFTGIRAVTGGLENGVVTLAALVTGALCFVASDAVLVFIIFKKRRGFGYEAANLITYYAAQTLLAGSIFLLV